MARTMKRTKLDGLPEDWDYRDEGCDLAPSCLRCPFPRCRYDEPGGVAAYQRRERDMELLALSRSGRDPHELATHFNISLRTVYRVMQSR